MSVGLDSRMDQAWGLLMDRSTGSIAVCGKGGVGKTTLMRQLYTKLYTKLSCANSTPNPSSFVFDKVIWVTVSSHLTREKIQDDIAKSVGLFNNKWIGKSFEEKAQLMLNQLSNKRFGLFLDDIWSRIDLPSLGVPNPTEPAHIGCKLIFTTRSKDLCKEMSAQATLELEELSIEDAWQLFRNKVGLDILRDPRNSELATYLVHRCGGLPILLCTVGRAMSRRKTHQEWMYAVEEILRMEFEGMGGDRFLHFCFNSLPHYRIKACLIYFSLFPEDSTVLKNDLIDFWICERILGVKGPTGHSLSLGYNAIDTLIGAGLLEDEEGECVKLLDMVRDCALKVAIKSQMFKNPQLLDPTDRETLETVGWVSPMGKSIKELANVPPNVYSFLLNHNPFIMIKGEFSQFMDALTVLDLSNSGVEEVPREISELVSLQYLNLSRTWIEQLPVELMGLGKLKCLNLEYDDQLRVIPKQMIISLSSLQVLKLFRCGFSVEEQEDNFLSVSHMDIDPLLSLEHLKVLSITLTCDSAFKRFFGNSKLPDCTQSLSLEVFWDSCSIDIAPLAAMKNLLTLEIHQVEKLQSINGSLHYSELPKEGCFQRLQKVSLGSCLSLQDLSWLILVPNLAVLAVKSCDLMEVIIGDGQIRKILEETGDLKPFAKLESLTLENLPKLESIYSKVLPFPCIRKIEVIDCPLLRKLPLNSECAKAAEMIIEAEEEWWNQIEWGDDATKATFVPCFKPLFL